MLLLFHGEIFLFIPGIFSLAAAVILGISLRKVAFIKANTILSGLVLLAAVFLLLAGIFFVWTSGFWYMVGVATDRMVARAQHNKSLDRSHGKRLSHQA